MAARPQATPTSPTCLTRTPITIIITSSMPADEQAATTSGGAPNDVSAGGSTTTAPVATATTTSATATTRPPPTKKQRRELSPAPPTPSLDPTLMAAVAQASHICHHLGLLGLATVLSSSLTASSGSSSSGGGGSATATAAAVDGSASTATSTTTTPTTGSSSSSHSALPSPAQVEAAARKAYTEQPPWVHWSKTDMAGNNAFKYISTTTTTTTTSSGGTNPHTAGTAEPLPNNRLGLTGAFRGYRMARASHGVSNGAYYYECWIQPGPTPQEIVQNLPVHARLGPGLQKALDAALAAVERNDQKKKQPPQRQRALRRSSSHSDPHNPDDRDPDGHNNDDDDDDDDGDVEEEIPTVGGNIRFGWSMRTGDLQAPVGYDKWSYAWRDGGGVVHQSVCRRQDTFGPFAPGDVVGAAIFLNQKDPQTNNHVRFFLNGECGGEFVLAKGKRSGGEAFTDLVSGTYYPAVSSYMAGSVVANFGPHFVYPARKLPPGLKFRPLGETCPPPPDRETVLAELQPVMRQLRREEDRQALQAAVAAETNLLAQIYEAQQAQHVRDVRRERERRGLSTADLE